MQANGDKKITDADASSFLKSLLKESWDVHMFKPMLKIKGIPNSNLAKFYKLVEAYNKDEFIVKQLLENGDSDLSLVGKFAFLKYLLKNILINPDAIYKLLKTKDDFNDFIKAMEKYNESAFAHLNLNQICSLEFFEFMLKKHIKGEINSEYINTIMQNEYFIQAIAQSKRSKKKAFEAVNSLIRGLEQSKSDEKSLNDSWTEVLKKADEYNDKASTAEIIATISKSLESLRKVNDFLGTLAGFLSGEDQSSISKRQKEIKVIISNIDLLLQSDVKSSSELNRLLKDANTAIEKHNFLIKNPTFVTYLETKGIIINDQLSPVLETSRAPLVEEEVKKELTQKEEAEEAGTVGDPLEQSTPKSSIARETKAEMAVIKTQQKNQEVLEQKLYDYETQVAGTEHLIFNDKIITIIKALKKKLKASSGRSETPVGVKSPKKTDENKDESSTCSGTGYKISPSTQKIEEKFINLQKNIKDLQEFKGELDKVTSKESKEYKKALKKYKKLVRGIDEQSVSARIKSIFDNKVRLSGYNILEKNFIQEELASYRKSLQTQATPQATPLISRLFQQQKTLLPSMNKKNQKKSDNSPPPNEIM